MMELKPMALVTFALGVATVFLGAEYLEGTAQGILLTAGGALLGLPIAMPGLGLVTKSKAERMASEPPPRTTARETPRAKRGL